MVALAFAASSIELKFNNPLSAFGNALISDGSNINITGELNIQGIANDGAGDILCVKADKTIGTCGELIGVVCTVCN